MENSKLQNIQSPKNGTENKFLPYIVMFALLFFPSGFSIPYNVGGTMILLICLALTFGFALFSGQCRIDMNLFIYMSVFVMCILVTNILCGDGLKQFLIYFIWIVVAILISQTKSFNFNTVYTKLIYFLSVFSLVMWALYVIFPPAVQLLPKLSNEYGLRAYTALFSTICPSGNMLLPRNQSIFWEAGAFQTFINIAVVIAMFSDEFAKKRKKYATVFAITILTTFSTTGYIVFCGILLTYFLNEIFTSKSSSRFAKYMTALLIIFIIFLSVYSALPDDAQFQLFGKLSQYFEEPDEMSSTSIRMNAVDAAISGFFTSPLWGNGTKYFGAGNDPSKLMTCTPLNFFAFYGIIVGFIANFGLFRYAKKIGKTTFLGIALFICLAMSTVSENFMRDPILLSLITLGLSRTTPAQQKDYGVVQPEIKGTTYEE